MAHKVLFFGTDDSYKDLKPFYDSKIKSGILEVVDVVDLSKAETVPALDTEKFDFAIISSHSNFYSRFKQLESLGVPRNNIIDGRAFQTPGFNFQRFLREGIAYGSLNRKAFKDKSRCIYPRIFSDEQLTIKLGRKSSVGGFQVVVRSDNFKSGRVRQEAVITAEKFCDFGTGIFCYMSQTKGHNYRSVTNYALTRADWKVPKDFLLPDGVCEIHIGNDVWIASNCILKSINPKKPLIIGDGAVVARDSVVVKSIPPYAIVGGSPAQIIGYRFPPDVIEAMLRIKWWDWSLDKIHDNFQYFNDIERFVALHDRS